jgi:thioredoxin
MTSKCLKIHYYSPKSHTSVDLPRPLCSPYFVFSSSQQIKIVTEQELEVEVANRECPMIIDFFATWCGPCVLLAKELEQVAEELGDQIKIIKIDCDENEAISSALQIQGLPTLIFIGMDPQKPALRTEGLLPAQAIIDIVQKELLAPAADA